MARITIRLPDDLDERVEDVLNYGESKSEFYRQAAEEKLAKMGGNEPEGHDEEIRN